MSDSDVRDPATLTIAEIKAEILRRAHRRAEQLRAGELDVPIRYVPLRLTTLGSLLDQLEYRQDFLDLAARPPQDYSIGTWAKSYLKNCLRRLCRWLLIRQVEFNQIAVKHAAETSRQLDALDEYCCHVHGVVSAMKLQMAAMNRRLAGLEGRPAPDELLAQPPEANTDSRFAEEGAPPDHALSAYQAALMEWLPRQGEILQVGCGHGDLVKHLLAEGFRVRGVDTEPTRETYFQDRELPIEIGCPCALLDRLAGGSLTALIWDCNEANWDTQEQVGFLSTAWRKLQPGSVCLAMSSRRAHHCPGRGDAMDEISHFLESQCFTVTDVLFGLPTDPHAPAWVRLSDGIPFNRRIYRACAVVGRK